MHLSKAVALVALSHLAEAHSLALALGSTTWWNNTHDTLMSSFAGSTGGRGSYTLSAALSSVYRPLSATATGRSGNLTAATAVTSLEILASSGPSSSVSRTSLIILSPTTGSATSGSRAASDVPITTDPAASGQTSETKPTTLSLSIVSPSNNLTATGGTRTSTVRVTAMSWSTVTITASSQTLAPNLISQSFYKSVSSAILPSTAAEPTASNSAASSTEPTPNNLGLGDTYTLYTGPGTVASGWPPSTSWLDFPTIWTANTPLIAASCSSHTNWNSPADPSPSEISRIHAAILTVANETQVPAQLILAFIMQESGGCVRAPTTNYGHDNPGLMQTFEGRGSCNTHKLVDGVLSDEGVVETPCPDEVIERMVREGTRGIDGKAMSIVSALSQVKTDFANKGLKLSTAGLLASAAGADASMFYRAARIYNSGSVDASDDLGAGIATHCYASDIANRLTGWVKAKSKCTLDG